MSNDTLWLIGGAALLYYLYTQNQAQQAAAQASQPIVSASLPGGLTVGLNSSGISASPGQRPITLNF